MIGKRSTGRHVTLQNLYRTIHLLTADQRVSCLTIAGQNVILHCIPEGKKHVDLKLLTVAAQKLVVDWSSQGPLKYIKGMSGSRMLAEDFKDQMLAQLKP